MRRRADSRISSIQRGFSLVPALFLLIVLAGLGVVAVRVTAVQSQTVVLGIQSSRAYSAARSGVDWAAYRALTSGLCGNSSLALSEGGLAGFQVTTSCSSTSHTEGNTPVQVFVIESFASSGVYGQPDYVSRRVRATFTDAG